MIKKIAVVWIAFCAGLVGGTLAATPVIAVMNFQATDGPYFPAPLVAFVLLALPISIMLFPIQILVLVYEAAAGRSLNNKLLILGLIAGLAAGSLWCNMLTPSTIIDPWMLAALCGLGFLQAELVFGCHWLACKSNFLDCKD